MAEVNTDSGGDHGKHGKKGRKKAGNPRVDMTPMVDLAFLLLTFFVLTSNLNKSKTMEINMPKDTKDTAQTTKINYKRAVTILLDGNKEGTIYYYEGKLTENTSLFETTLDPKKGLRSYVMGRNSQIVGDMKDLRNEFKKGNMNDSTFKARKSAIQTKYSDSAPFFIIKWGGDATYGDVISTIDELKISDVEMYALTPISRTELEGLSKKTGRHYKELDTPDPTTAPSPQ
ncbi:MAG TPA: biopolymer transporter ExbD [Bacteroidia bacterium]|nr:biopolymer transporter ExbD [Bacteroidia bacterium]